MHLKAVRLRGFKRFTDARIEDLPAEARLVVLAGPNGSGKSSLFDGLKTWHWTHGAPSSSWDESYGTKVGTPTVDWSEHVVVEFHESIPGGANERKKLVYLRSAFRNEADFNVTGFNRMGSPLDAASVAKTIDQDESVSNNYQRLIMETIDGIYSDDLPEDMTRVQLRDRVIGRVRQAMALVFPDLQLGGVGGVTSSSGSAGTFYFSKGSSSGFLYKNLSAGEKAAFDLLLDATVRGAFFDDSIWCIDEPEAHLNTRVQGRLLSALMDTLPRKSQLLLATHSIGFMRRAWEMARTAPGSVIFIDMQDVDFDSPVVLRPVRPTRDFWARTLDVALGDLAALMAPEHVVLCEGRPSRGAQDHRGEFDAACYRRIFGETHPETDFLSVGNSADVTRDRLGAAQTIQTLARGTRLTRLIDRDLMAPQVVNDREAMGVRVLGRRQIESYLLDDEVLSALCESVGQPQKAPGLIQARDIAQAAAQARGHDRDDLKCAAGEFLLAARKLLELPTAGSTWAAFARESLAPLIAPGTAVFSELEHVIFGARPNSAHEASADGTTEDGLLAPQQDPPEPAR